MISLDITKLEMSREQIKEIRKRVQKDAVLFYRQRIYYLFQQAVLVAPQFSGEFASNFALEIEGRSTPVFRPWPGKNDLPFEPKHLPNGRVEYQMAPHKAGDLEAVGTAMARMTQSLRYVTDLNQTVHIVNPMPLDTDGTHMTGPDGTVDLRPENIIDGGVRIEAYVEARAREAGIST